MPLPLLLLPLPLLLLLLLLLLLPLLLLRSTCHSLLCGPVPREAPCEGRGNGPEKITRPSERAAVLVWKATVLVYLDDGRAAVRPAGFAPAFVA